MSLEVIQIIEDDPIQARVMDSALRKASFRTNVARDGQTGIEDIKRLLPALVLTDVMVPGINGHDLCRLLRQDPKTRELPIITVTALAAEEYRVYGLELGADDYLVKPFGAAELVARVRAVLRRTRGAGPSVRQGNGDGLTLEEEQVVALFRGRQVTLSGQEWKLLRRLSNSGGEVVPREELSALLWGEDGLIHDHELDRQIQQLGRKLNDGALCAGSILRVPGGGYRLSSLRP
jgi:DNA-binding response OmpR family regulator